MEGVLQNFEEAALPHLGAAYNLARWLTRDDSDAEDSYPGLLTHARARPHEIERLFDN